MFDISAQLSNLEDYAEVRSRVIKGLTEKYHEWLDEYQTSLKVTSHCFQSSSYSIKGYKDIIAMTLVVIYDLL